MSDLLVYGSYGYVGSLIVRKAVEAGLDPILAGRRTESVERQAAAYDLDHRAFSLEHRDIVEEHVAEASAVLNCAGPFVYTAEPLRSACLRTGTDYVDVAGEIETLEAAAARGDEAEDAGVTLLSGAGFDVVPTDCLAAHLADRLPGAERIALAIDGMGTFSPGTLKSIVDGFSRAGAVRVGGGIRSVPAAWKRRRVDFGGKTKSAVTVPWGAVSTTYYTTGIPNVEVYAAVPGYAVPAMRLARSLAPVLGVPPVRAAAERLIDATVSGPTAEERARSVSRIWGAVGDGEGNRAAARLRTPDTYDVTAATAVEAARRTLDGEVDAGFRTPASAFGPDFVLGFDGVEREDVAPEGAAGE